jgi:hypothetical protein
MISGPTTIDAAMRAAAKPTNAAAMVCAAQPRYSASGT